MSFFYLCEDVGDDNLIKLTGLDNFNARFNAAENSLIFPLFFLISKLTNSSVLSSLKFSLISFSFQNHPQAFESVIHKIHRNLLLIISVK